MNEKLETKLSETTLQFDSVCEEIKKLEEQKAKLRKRLIKLYNEAVREDYPYLDNPDDQGFHFVNPANGLIYKKSVAEVGTKFDHEKFLRNHKPLNDLFSIVTPKEGYDFDEKAAAKAIAVNPKIKDLITPFIVPGKTQVRIYQGTAPTSEDL